LPGRSIRSIWPAGKKATSQGISKLLTTTARFSALCSGWLAFLGGEVVVTGWKNHSFKTAPDK